MEDILKIFNTGGFEIPESLKKQFSVEIVNNVFNAEKRTELCLNEEDIISSQQKRSDRGFSIDESPELM
jgi:hypothetical protein